MRSLKSCFDRAVLDAAVSLAYKAIELFADCTSGAARFHITDDNAAAVTKICRRLDAMPSASLANIGARQSGTLSRRRLPRQLRR